MSLDTTLNFGPFSLMPRQRMLLEGGVPVRLGSRAFDLLVTLVERSGDVVSNAELIARVWPNVVIEPGALRVHLAGLRKVLGDGREAQRYIVNVPLQGYCFVAEVTRAMPSETAGNGMAELASLAAHAVPAQSRARPPALADAPAPATPAAISVVGADAPARMPLPAQITRLIGREDVVIDLLRELPQRRCVTVVGPAGMGKTTVVLAAARQLASSFDQQAVFVSLAPLNDAALVIHTVISALGISALASDPLRGLLAYLRDRRMLIVLDNCEHVIEAAAELSEALLSGATGVHLLVTSREPLRIQGEWVQRLGALQVPPSVEPLSLRDVLRYPSVELFVERVRAGLDAFDLDEADLRPLVDICRALDGIPLALELAAAGVDRLGLRGVAAHLGDRLALLTRGRRTALPRHQTLRAALDWGYALLTDEERRLLRALSIFRSRFTADGARALLQGAGIADVEELLYNLVSKSLLTSDISGETVQYWLLETTREYALAQMDARQERAEIARRHAAHMLDLADEAERLRPHQSSSDWLAHHAYLLEDIRFALHWSLSASGDPKLGAALAGASAPLWYALSRMAEFLELVERLLDTLAGATPLDPHREIALRKAQGHALWNIRGAGPATVGAFQRALNVAREAGSIPDQLHALWGLWLVNNSSGHYAVTVDCAQQYGALVEHTRDPADAVVHDRMMTLSMHFTGQHARARMHAQRVLDQPLSINASARHSGFHFDQRVAALMTLSRILWIHGYPEQALDHAERAIERALGINHSLSLCFALSVGCAPVAFWYGDIDRAERYTTLLCDRAREYSLVFWGHFGTGYRLVLDRLRGISHSVAVPVSWPRSLRDTLCTLDAALPCEADFERGRSGAVPWISPELLRIQGDRLRRDGEFKMAEQCYRSGLKMANEQEARSLSLRCAISLAGMLEETISARAARAVLAPVYDTFDEGLSSLDLRSAARLLERVS